MAEVHAEELPGAGVEGEPLGRPPAADPAGRVGVHDRDRAPGEQVAGDAGDRGPGQPDAAGDVGAAERAAPAQEFEDPLLVRPADQRMRSVGP
jgi:hypothetical protein